MDVLFLSWQKQVEQSTIFRPRLVLAKQPVKTELRQYFWSDLSGHLASPDRIHIYTKHGIEKRKMSVFRVGTWRFGELLCTKDADFSLSNK